MAPCIAEVPLSKSLKEIKEVLNLPKLRAAIPKDVFAKSVPTAFAYMFFDYFMWGASVYAVQYLSTTGIMDSLPFYQQALISFAFWNVAGFFMWCIFVVGHDCGHGTFSDSELLNDIVGHICHGSILVPYYPWQLSHSRHHMKHNHINDDYSHPWYEAERFERPEEKLAKWMNENASIRAIFPFVGWPLYLYGMPDGSHFIPWSSQRMWAECGKEYSKEAIKCMISAVNVIAWVTAIYYFYGQTLNSLVYYHLAPGVFCGWWLVTVTYLQHHDEDTLVYDDANFDFVNAAFQTVDRTFGWYGILDKLHHNITDGHVAHHLFFRAIPHYNLMAATKAIKEYMVKNGLSDMYKYEVTTDFVYKVHKNFVNFGFKAVRAPGTSTDIKKVK